MKNFLYLKGRLCLNYRERRAHCKGVLLSKETSRLWILCVLCVLCSSLHPANAESESAYERIMRTGEIRCGYSSWKPLFWMDSNTGQPRGIFHDLMEEVGKRLDLKIHWSAELGWGEVAEAVNTHKVDMACAGYWLHPSRIKYLQATDPLFYSSLHVWVREEDKHKYRDMQQLNRPEYTVVEIDGGSAGQIIEKYFPNAQRISLPQLSTNGDVILNLMTKKADFFIDDVTSFYEYQQENPGKLATMFIDTPLAVFPATMLLPREQSHLKSMIDNTLSLVELDGTLDDILNKYQATDLFLCNPDLKNVRGEQ